MLIDLALYSNRLIRRADLIAASLPEDPEEPDRSQGLFRVRSARSDATCSRLSGLGSTLALCLLILGILGVSSCAFKTTSSRVATPELGKSAYTSFDGSRFPYRKWLPSSGQPPTTVVVGFHGIAGASSDWDALGSHLQDCQPAMAVYAPELRGQGNDPVFSRRGDIKDPQNWFNDFRSFTQLLRHRHPEARIIWCGESMSTLIALHGVAASPTAHPPCDALILSSPIVRIHDDLPQWKRTALRWGSTIFPRFKISLETLSGEDEVRVIRDVVHQEQAQTNSYHVSAFTLRLLNTLGTMIESLPAQADRINLPLLILHGGHDIFSKPDDVVSFAEQFPPTTKIMRHFYPESYHLLFYDNDRQRVLTAISQWLVSLDGP